MPNDAKLGLVVGVGLVIAVAVVFFRKELPPVSSSPDNAAATVGNPAVPGPSAQPRGVNRPAKAKTMARGEETDTPGTERVVPEWQDQPTRPDDDSRPPQ